MARARTESILPPDRVAIDRASLTALTAGRLPSGPADLARRGVIVDLPKHYD